MVMKHKEQRVAIFFDIQNLYHSAKNLYQARVNFKEVLKAALAGRKLIRAIGYVVKSETAEGESSFFDALEKIGIELRMKDLQVYPGGFKKADWDVGMAVDTIRLKDSVDAIVLITGDGDFIPLIEYLNGLGKQVEVIGFGRSASAKIKEKADEFFDLESQPGKFLINPRLTKKRQIK
ncbi:MAG: NYN domain-containing protein [bacterium]|nr:NYN domain-containing protein [bacterium]